MDKNVGTTDKRARLIVGAILLVVGVLSIVGLPLLALGGWAWLVALVGLVMVGTALMGFCPAYTLLGVNTCRKN